MAKENRKVNAREEADYRVLSEEFDIVLVEADGAKMLPMKAPYSYEPVIPRNAKLVIAVLGAKSIGKALSETCYNSDFAAKILCKSLDDIVTLEDLKMLLDSDLSQRKNVCVDYRMVIGQSDLLEERVKCREDKYYYFSKELYR